MTEEIRVTDIEYHRNGIGGEPFHVAKVVHGASTQLIAVVFEERGRVAIVQPDDMTSRWRGDWFEPALRRAIKAWRVGRGWEEAAG